MESGSKLKLAVFGFILVAFVFVVWFIVLPVRFTVRFPDVFPADGESPFKVEVEWISRSGFRSLMSGDFGFTVSSNFVKRFYRSGEEIFITPELTNGTVEGVVFSGAKTNFFSVKIRISTIDSDGDGFPDVAELTSESDRNRFRRWFVLIAVSQFYKPSPFWAKENRNCAGFIVFCVREALKKHTESWSRRFPFLVSGGSGDVEKFNFPDVPILGNKIFRTNGGSFSAGDEKKHFSTTATTPVLVDYNLVKVGRDLNNAETGDILVFVNPSHTVMPYHTMIYIKKPFWFREELREPLVIYHTGPDGTFEGEIRMVKIRELMNLNDSRWHPVPENPFFAGVYRWKWLD